MSYYIRYFATRPISAKAIHQGLQAVDPTFKIDLGELVRGEVALGQVEVNQAQGDLFEDDLRQTVSLVEATGNGAAVVPRLRAAAAIVVVGLEWNGRSPDDTLALVAPLWNVLAQLSPGLSQWEGSGVFDGGQCLVDLSAS
ncbi:MAG: hypothetical protein KBG28_12680 [Kofleriaceae bacterium]|nr:hypothetical protein [Kofleriaceae bacterium]MBP6836384.1 hypothetical protein [Kofleriaceae bacterium]MBP9204817.1 hypothetical protein [Kofleriaceae bacterium]